MAYNKYDNEAEVLLNRVIDISPLAMSIVNGENYRQFTETDEITTESILEDCVVALQSDFLDIGIVPLVDISEIYSTQYVFKQCLTVIEYLMPNTLYVKIKRDPELYKIIANILDGQSTSGNTIMFEYLSALGGLEDGNFYREDLVYGCEFLLDKITNNSIFNTYLTNLITLIGGETSDLDSQRLANMDVSRYTKFMTTLLKQVFSVYGLLYEKLDIPDKDKVFDIIKLRIMVAKQYYSNPINMDNLYYYHLIKDTTPDGLKRKNIIKNTLRSSLKLYETYYLVRGQELTLTDLLGVCCWTIRPILGEDNINKALNIFIKSYPAYSNVLEQIKYIYIDYLLGSKGEVL